MWTLCEFSVTRVLAHGKNILLKLGRQEEGVMLLAMSNSYTEN